MQVSFLLHVRFTVVRSKKSTSQDTIPLQKALKEACLKTNEELLYSSIETQHSGTTAVLVVIRGTSMLCANVGDSRAVLGKKNGKSWLAIPLSKDHKPNDPIEKTRIEINGGKVEPFRNSEGNLIGPSRVWKAGERSPGLAMSRSLGDFEAKQVGVIADPEITEFRVSAADKFLIIGSDGLWDAVSNIEAVQMVGEAWEAGSPDLAVDKLTKKAVREWKKHDFIVDDITVVVVFLREYPKYNSL